MPCKDIKSDVIKSKTINPQLLLIKFISLLNKKLKNS